MSNATGSALTVEMLMKTMLDFEEKMRALEPDPLAGMTLYPGKGTAGDALNISESRSSPMNFMGLPVIPSRAVPEGFIVATDHKGQVLVIDCREKDVSTASTEKPTQ